ncbi:calcyclin-binding protein isoform X2 [Eurytemora carolleeae]|uniref:calcyclin-binding protein isoform X2 n=1 Tax=Eurytemora carolleeae TaxID=1294199 RepID=UPI000C78054D|nr:calcyclin-binding protein isoform X2 [Eurytemora carolleeae]|eukprot:XP_023324108.1 calcyclin-binding protein-like isoform X2 [Eurytemora affinis]
MSLENKLQEVESDISELKSLLEKATRHKVKELLSADVGRLETDQRNLKAEIKKAEARIQENKAKTCPEIQIKDYSWDQSEKFVKLYLTGLQGLGELNPENIKVSYTEQSLTVRIESLNGKTPLFSINKTCHKISPDKSYFKIKSDYLLVFLSKHNPGSSWSHITYAEKCAADAKKSSEGFNDKEDPSAGLMNMMKKMYNEGDDEMKRTIAKAWTEGQGKRGGGMPDLDF